jgi:prolipoprotein diacylglyceryltransferase
LVFRSFQALTFQNCANKGDKTMDKIDETIFWLLLFIVIGAVLTLGAYLTEGDYE